MNILSLDPHQKWPHFDENMWINVATQVVADVSTMASLPLFKHVWLLKSKLISGCYSLFMFGSHVFLKKQNHQLINHVLNGIMLGIIEHNPYTYKEWWFIHHITNGETKHNDYLVSGS